MEIIQRVCELHGDPVPAGMKPIYLNDKKHDICGIPCLLQLVTREYENPDNVIFVNTKKLEVIKQKEA